MKITVTPSEKVAKLHQHYPKMVRVFVKGGPWTNIEDEALRALVQKVGLNRWASIATSIGHKSPEQCQQRWVEYLDPDINKGDWTAAEKRKLVQLYEVFPEQWQSIASQLPHRRHWQAKKMYVELRDGGRLAEHGDDEAAAAVPTSADGEIVGTGDYKLYHEMRPAKADTVDGDEYNKQVIEFTRTRLANQKGRKQLRREKDSVLAQSKMLDTLERRREMEAAGIETHTQKRAFARAVEEDERGRALGRRADGLDSEDDDDANYDDEDGEADENDDNAAPMRADLADIVNINAGARQAASRKKTMLMASDLNAAQKKKEVAVLTGFDIGLPTTTTASAAAARGKTQAAATSTSAAAPLALAGGLTGVTSAVAPAREKVLAITADGHGGQRHDALSALMAQYLAPSAAALPEKVLVGGAAAAAPMSLGSGMPSFITEDDIGGDLPLPAAASAPSAPQQQLQGGSAFLGDLLSFDDMPAPTNNNTSSVFVGAATADDLFGDIPAPTAAVSSIASSSAVVAVDPLNFDFLSDVPAAAAAATTDADGKAFAGDAEEEGEDDDDEDEDEPTNYISRAVSLLHHQSHVRWDAKGEWDSARQQTDYLRLAREMVHAELAANLSLSSFLAEKGAGDAADSRKEGKNSSSALLASYFTSGDDATPPPLVHPRVARMQAVAASIVGSFNVHADAAGNADADDAAPSSTPLVRTTGAFSASLGPLAPVSVSYPSGVMQIAEEEAEIEAARAACAADLGITAATGHSSSDSSSDDAAVNIPLNLTLDDAPAIAKASAAKAAAAEALAEAERALAFYTALYNSELPEAARRREEQRTSAEGLLLSAAVAKAVQPNTKRAREEEEPSLAA